MSGDTIIVTTTAADIVAVTTPAADAAVVAGSPAQGPAGNGIPSTPASPNLFLQSNGVGGNGWGTITQDQIAAAYSVSLSLTGASSVLLGSTVTTPAFTASYVRTAAASVLSDSNGNLAVSEISTPTAFSSLYSFTKSTFGQSVTFTLTANETGGPSKTSTQTITWLQPAYWGAAVPGTLNAAFIQALGSSALASSRARTFSATAGATERIYYAVRSAFGLAANNFSVGGFTGGFSRVASAVSVTNASSVTETYDLWASDNLNLGATTVVVS